jgi:hypothetical protein
MKMRSALQTHFLGACAWMLLAGPLLCAADPSETTAPTAPWVAPVPENAEWMIAVSRNTPGSAPTAPAPANANAKSPVELQTIHVIKTGITKRDTLTYSDGSTEEAWYIGKTALLTDTFVKTNIYLAEFSPVDFTGTGDPVHSLGFTGVSWLDSRSYDKIVTYQNVSCYHYRLHGELPAEAWIRIKDKMPVAYQVNGFLYVYSFGAPPATPLVLPPAYQAIWNQSLLIKKRQEMYQRDLGKH